MDPLAPHWSSFRGGRQQEVIKKMKLFLRQGQHSCVEPACRAEAHSSLTPVSQTSQQPPAASYCCRPPLTAWFWLLARVRVSVCCRVQADGQKLQQGFWSQDPEEGLHLVLDVRRRTGVLLDPGPQQRLLECAPVLQHHWEVLLVDGSHPEGSEGTVPPG